MYGSMARNELICGKQKRGAHPNMDEGTLRVALYPLKTWLVMIATIPFMGPT